MAGKRRWETRALAIMAYPANLAFAGLAAFVLALPIVTGLSACVAAGRALHGWLTNGDDRVFTHTFREFGATWRRTLPASTLASLAVVVIVTNVLFLGSQDGPVAYLFAMATVPVAAALALIIVMLPAAAARAPDRGMREWLSALATLAAARPASSVILVVIVGAFGLTCVLLPTIVPFFGLSLPVWLGLITAERATTRISSQQD